ncbi:hypothetical protein [Brevibacillus daliensis]|uniref:hypothetical protein n=1 Tax=Brevibacillus daliensis TaxID=2892995 RepID=UPI001E5FF9A9|nr:hypothetical protein [Brevibacillus daliensis]
MSPFAGEGINSALMKEADIRGLALWNVLPDEYIERILLSIDEKGRRINPNPKERGSASVIPTLFLHSKVN